MKKQILSVLVLSVLMMAITAPAASALILNPDVETVEPASVPDFPEQGAPAQNESGKQPASLPAASEAFESASIPAPQAEAASIPEIEPETSIEAEVDLFDDQVPLSNGLGMAVEIMANLNAPTYGDKITLSSVVRNPKAGALCYQWQMDSGNGYVDIVGANEASYSFEFSQALEGCAFRVFVDVAAA